MDGCLSASGELSIRDARAIKGVGVERRVTAHQSRVKSLLTT